MAAGHRARDQHDEFGVAGIMFEDQRRMRVAKRFELFVYSFGTIGGLAARARVLAEALEPARVASKIGGEGATAAAFLFWLAAHACRFCDATLVFSGANRA